MRSGIPGGVVPLVGRDIYHPGDDVDLGRPEHSESPLGSASAQPRSPLLVIAVGASAGGLQSLQQLLQRLNGQGLCLLVVQHLLPTQRSALPSLLARVTTMRVTEILDGDALEPDTVHVAPAGSQVQVEDGMLRLRPLNESGPQHPIDALFRSLAAHQGARSVGVVLSGAGSDGSEGVREIKRAGGITFAEEPSEAVQAGMPQRAIDSGSIDFALAPSAIADELMRVATESPDARSPTGPRLGPDVLVRILGQLQRAYAVDFSAYKLTTVERRIGRRMLLKRIEDASAYLAMLEAQRAELHALYQDLLIGVTSFFRDLEPFALLSDSILPALLDGDATQPVRVWVPGCATGEEAYSIAMCLLEQVEKHPQPRKLQLFATDINEDALTRARLGVYPASIESSVSAERLQRFFRRTTQGDYQVARHVRDAVVFARHNLGKDPPFSRLDLVSCRNVLIYLQPALQRRVMRIFHYALRPQGCLMLGTAESVGEASDLFSLVDRKLKIYVKKHGASPGVFEFAFGPAAAAVARPSATTALAGERKVEVSFQQIIERKILDKYGPPGVALDEALNILQFRGQCGPFLAPTPGTATLNMLRMIRPELLAPLKAIVQRVIKEGVAASCEPVRMIGRDSAVIMDVMPVEAAPEGRCLLLMFRESAELPQATSLTPADGSAPEPEHKRRLLELERELSTMRDYQETIIQELATSNEELQSSNEELQSSNEELQSTNEELETSKEELQATNEELVTVNEELQARIDQLSIANDDVVNLLTSSSSPILLVDLDLRIRRFSSAAERLLNLIQSDVGRPVSYLGMSLNVPQIEATVRDAINAIHPRELRVRCSNGAWYTMRTVPYQTSDRSVRGGVIELLPFPTLSGAYDTSELHLLAGQVLATLPYQLVLVDSAMRIVWANDAFLGAWDHGADLSGRALDAVLGSREALPDLWKQVDDIVLWGQPFPELSVTHNWGKQGERTLRWTARTVPVQPQRALTLFVIDEPARTGS